MQAIDHELWTTISVTFAINMLLFISISTLSAPVSLLPSDPRERAVMLPPANFSPPPVLLLSAMVRISVWGAEEAASEALPAAGCPSNVSWI